MVVEKADYGKAIDDYRIKKIFRCAGENHVRRLTINFVMRKFFFIFVPWHE